jgi:hypothetical protein
MAIVEYALCQAHRNNINRYERLLKTYLTNIERKYIELRLSEERDAMHFIAPALRGDDLAASENLAPPSIGQHCCLPNSASRLND